MRDREQHTTIVPASVGRRVVHVLTDVALLLAVFALSLVPAAHHGILFALGATAALMAVMTLMTMVTGASPGGLVAGVRLRRVSSQRRAPGLAAAAYMGFVLLAAIPTAGLGALVLWLTSLVQGSRRSWFDRMAGTVLVSRRVTAGSCSLVLGGDVVPVDGPLVLGRHPSPVDSCPRAQLVAVMQDDDSVSKTHLLVLPDLNGVLMTDLGSTNGTYVEGEEGLHRLAPGHQEYVGRGRQAYLGDGVCVVR